MKAGGPGYVTQFMHVTQKGLPRLRHYPHAEVNRLIDLCGDVPFTAEELGLWYGSVCNYAHTALHFPMQYQVDDPKGLVDEVIGQDNALYYVPRMGLVFRVQEQDSIFDVLRVLAAALCMRSPMHISWEKSPIMFDLTWEESFPLFSFVKEETALFLEKVEKGAYRRVRMLSHPNQVLQQMAAKGGCFIDSGTPIANGEIELRRHVREVALSYDYHRYGNLGERELKYSN